MEHLGRARLSARTLFVGLTPERTFETPGAVVARWLLEQVIGAVEAFRPADGARGWLGRLAALHTAASESLSHVVLRRIEPRRPAAWERQHCAQSHDPVLRQAAAALAFHDLLLPLPEVDVLRRTVERFALAPTSKPRRFELFTLLAPWAEGDPVAFLDPEGCLGPPLGELVRTWLEAARQT